MPGVSVLFTTPLGMRIDEGLGGTPADLSVRIFGPDLDELARLAEQAEGRIRAVDGVADLRAEQLTGLPQLQIAVNREATARVGWRRGTSFEPSESAWLVKNNPRSGSDSVALISSFG